MALRSLVLQDFRRYDQMRFDFDPQVNLIWGSNARGKTSVLEAVYLLTIGRSFRTSQLKDLIRKGADSFHVHLTFVKHGVEQVIRFSYNGKEYRVLHNQTQYRSPAAVLGILQGVVVTPDDASLVKDSPSIRRRFLDAQIAQVDPLYVHHLMRYMRSMKQRNALLKARNLGSIETWEQQMAVAAEYITKQRSVVVQDLSRMAQSYYGNLSEETDLFQIQFPSELRSADEYLKKYNKHRSREMDLGFTLVGPHKDDILMMIGDKEARHFASEGQQRSCVAALRLAEWERLRTLADESPIMLYDDVGMSLDDSRKDRLFRFLENLDQVFLTSTQDLNFGDRNCHRITV